MLNFIAAIAGNGAGGGGSFESIATATGTGSSGTITFSSIPSSYKHLQIRGNVTPSTSNGTQAVRIQLNGSTGTYRFHYLSGNGSTTEAGSGSSPAYSAISTLTQSSIGSASYPVPFIIDIHDYASATKNKTTRHFIGQDSNNTGVVAGSIELSSGLWVDTSAISSVSIIMQNANFTTSSTVALYGIKGA